MADYTTRYEIYRDEEIKAWRPNWDAAWKRAENEQRRACKYSSQSHDIRIYVVKENNNGVKYKEFVGILTSKPEKGTHTMNTIKNAVENVEIPALFPTNNGIRIVTTREKPLTYMQAKRSLARKGLWFNRRKESKERKYFAHNIRTAREGGFKTIFSEWESDIALLKFVQAYRMGFLDGQRNCFHNEALGF